jgi:hypothetical protein
VAATAVASWWLAPGARASWPAVALAAVVAPLAWAAFPRATARRVVLAAVLLALAGGGMRVARAVIAERRGDAEGAAAAWRALGDVRRHVRALLAAWDGAGDGRRAVLMARVREAWAGRPAALAVEARHHLGDVRTWRAGACDRDLAALALDTAPCTLAVRPGERLDVEVTWDATRPPRDAALLVVLGHTRVGWQTPEGSRAAASIRVPWTAPEGARDLVLSLHATATDADADAAVAAPEGGVTVARIVVGAGGPPPCESAPEASGDGGLLADGSFEDGAGAWTVAPQHGYTARVGAGCAAHGTYALLWEFPGGTDPNAYGSFQAVRLPAGRRYVLTYYVRAHGLVASAAGTPRMEVVRWPEAEVLAVSPGIRHAGAWQRAEVAFVVPGAPGDTALVRVRPRRYGEDAPRVAPSRGPVTGLVWWDALRLVERP